MKSSDQFPNISEHLTYKESIKSREAIKNGIDNTPNAAQLVNMRHLAINVFEPTRLALGGFPITASSFFRCVLLNTEIRGADDSQHIAENGAAIDLDVDGSIHFYNYQIFNYIYEHLDYDQLIWEYGDKYNPAWVHVSFSINHNRKKALVAYHVWDPKKKKNVTKYKPYTL